jgi:hypothetical protein
MSWSGSCTARRFGSPLPTGRWLAALRHRLPARCYATSDSWFVPKPPTLAPRPSRGTSCTQVTHEPSRPAADAAADADLTTAVITDVEAELAAVERAELGDLSGRSVQAVQLTRQDASPVQVAAADQVLAQNPLGGNDLFLELDSTSACVAAAHWLQAAANVVAEISGIAATNVVMEADNIEALPHATPTAVLELMDLGMSPTAAVTGLIRDATIVADGEVPDLDELRDKIEKAEANAERYGRDDPEAAAEFRKIRLTTLDPRRPARDMLEDMLSGIRGCWLLYQEYAETPGDLADDDAMSHDELDDAIDEAFCDAVRARAASDRYRLDLEP